MLHGSNSQLYRKRPDAHKEAICCADGGAKRRPAKKSWSSSAALHGKVSIDNGAPLPKEGRWDMCRALEHAHVPRSDKHGFASDIATTFCATKVDSAVSGQTPDRSGGGLMPAAIGYCITLTPVGVHVCAPATPSNSEAVSCSFRSRHAAEIDVEARHTGRRR